MPKHKKKHNRNINTFAFGALAINPIVLKTIHENKKNSCSPNKPYIRRRKRKKTSSNAYPNFRYYSTSDHHKKRYKKTNNQRKRNHKRPQSATVTCINIRAPNQCKKSKRKNIKSTVSPITNKNSIQFAVLNEHLRKLQSEMNSNDIELDDMLNMQRKEPNAVQENQTESSVHTHIKNEQKCIQKIVQQCAENHIAIYLPTSTTNSNSIENTSENMNEGNNNQTQKPKHQNFRYINKNNPSAKILSQKTIQKRKSVNMHFNKKRKKNHQRVRRQSASAIYTTDNSNMKNTNLGNHKHQFQHSQPFHKNRQKVKFSSVFASNTPRIYPLKKLYPNIMTPQNNHSSPTKKQRIHSARKSLKQKSKRKKKKRKSKIQQYPPRPKSAITHKTLKTMISAEDEIKVNTNIINYDSSSTITSSDSIPDSVWNPFYNITVFELQYFIKFIRNSMKINQDFQHLNTEILHILDQCLVFHVKNDAYSTAWNAWNIIQKFLLSDTDTKYGSSLNINKYIVREVLNEYKAQSRDLKNNQISEALFDEIIQELGLQISLQIKDRKQFRNDFEQYLIESQKINDEKYLKTHESTIDLDIQSPQISSLKKCERSKSANIVNCSDLIHYQRIDKYKNIKSRNTNSQSIRKVIRPQSAFPTTKIRNIVTQTNGRLKSVEKYVLDGVIDDL